MTEVLAPAIELPIVFYDHPERLGDIALVGMVHALPSTDVYGGIKSFVDTREWDGSQIHFEGVRDATYAELGRVDRNTRRRYGHLLTMFDYERRFFKTLGLASQKDGLSRNDSAPATWQNHDISILDMAIRLPGELVDAMLHESLNNWSYVNRLSPHQRTLFVGLLMKKLFTDEKPDFTGLPELASSDYIDDVLDHYNDLLDDIEMTRREKVALNAVETTLMKDPNTSLTLLWGVEHLPALGRGIKALGYEQRDEWC